MQIKVDLSSHLQFSANMFHFSVTMLQDIWFPFVTFFCLAWMAWIVIFNRRRIYPPLPPGPKGLPVVGNLPFLDPELHSYFTGLARTYGPIFSLRLGTKLSIVVSSPSLAKEVLKDFDVTFANRDVPAVAREGIYGGLDIAFRSYGPEWRMLRKVCARELLGSATLNALNNLRKREIDQTMLQVQEQEGCVVNIEEQMFLTSMNVMTSMLWGGTVIGDDRARVGAEFRAAVSRFMGLLGSPDISDFIPALARFDLQGIVKKVRDCAKKLDDILEAVIDGKGKMDGVVQDKDFLQFLLELKDSGGSKTLLTVVEVKALFLDLILAGTDTTSNTIEFAMAEMMKNPQIMRQAQQELETVVGIGNRVEESHIHQLPYLQAIMKETLRLHPVGPLLIPHCPSQSCVVGGYTIPKGSRVFINAWGIQRDPLLWENPLEFKPERFLDGKHDFSGNNFNYIPFGSGRRICAGIALAERMIMVLLASLLHYFDWKLPKGVEKVDVSEKFGLTIKMREPLLLVPSPRSSNLAELNSTSTC